MVKLYELSASTDACVTKRKFSIELNEKVKENVLKSAVIKRLISQINAGAVKKEDVKDVLRDELEAIGYMNPLQFEVNLADAYKQIERLVHSVDASGMILQQADPLLENIGHDVEVMVNPDYYCLHEDVDGDKILTIIRIKCSKPTITQKAANDGESMELYALIRYGRRLAQAMEKMGVHVEKIEASFYFLRKSNDSPRNAKFDVDFFDTKGGKNIVTIKDTGAELDAQYDAKIKAYADGIPEEECNQEDCEQCGLHDLCKFTEAPLAIEKIPVNKSLSDLNLTSAQMEAIEIEKGVYRINAGAGAGKTMVIALRTATLIAKGYDPKRILLVTFTNAGAEEMRSRIRMCLEDFGIEQDISEMPIKTFHAFGNEILQKDWSKLDGFSGIPKVIDEVEKNHIIAEILNENPVKGLDFRNMTLNMPNCIGALPMTALVFSLIKEKQYGLGDADALYNELGHLRRFCTRDAAEKLLELYDIYDDRLRQENLIEFSDMEILVLNLLQKDPFYMEQFHFEHVIVDEFQDTSENQMEFLKSMIEGPDFKSLMVIGDDSQAIYGFRGTTPEYIINFEKWIGKPVKDIMLMENHRSTPEIIEFANKINAMNHYRVIKDLIATRPSGKKPVVRGFFTPAEEQAFVADMIQQHLDAGTPAEDMAIIAATKPELQKMASVLQERGIPTVMLNPEPLIENSRVRAAISFATALRNPWSTKDLLNYANAKAGGGLLHATEEEIRNAMDEAKSVIEQIRPLPEQQKKEAIIEEMRSMNRNDDEVYESFIDTLEYKNVAKIYEYCDDFYVFGEKSALRRTHDYPGVALTTAHSSKGLEWPICFNMISKYHKGAITRIDIEEEIRRLLFVSATRARDELYVTAQYVAFGKRGDYTYNQFLVDSYNAAGMEFSATSIEAERAAREAERKAKKAAEKLQKELDK